MTGLAAGDLVGTWRLLDWSAEADDGTIERPFGERPLGYVVYTAGGLMITTISRRDRIPIGGDLLSASVHAQASSFSTFIAYSGAFRVEGGDVVHSVEMSMYPDWIGGEQRRHVDLDGSGARLTLSTGPLLAGGRTSRHRLDWERVGD